jgi:hypothetical protein
MSADSLSAKLWYVRSTRSTWPIVAKGIQYKIRLETTFSIF